MEYTITPMTVEDREPVMDIFNYYIEHSFAAYRESRLPIEAFDMFLEASRGYPTGIIRDDASRVLGFGLLRAHKAIPEFSHTAEVAYFLHPDYRGVGLGRALLMQLEREGREQGITIFLASISSRNPQSLEFHKRNGFRQCGCFRDVGRKNDQTVDIIWMQKML